MTGWGPSGRKRAREAATPPSPACLTATGSRQAPTAPTTPRTTGKEHDPESGNDYFEARYYSDVMGRFMSPDWSAKEDPVPYAVLDDPQSLNLYSYVRNNPLGRIDADGHQEGGVVCAIECRLHTSKIKTGGAILLSLGAALIKAEFKRETAFFSSSGSETPDTPTPEEAPAAAPAPPLPLPASPDDLKDQGYTETSHPDAAAAGHRTFENPKTGDKVRHDKGKPGASGREGEDHYHRYNPNATGKGDQYLDANGKPVPRGSDASHLKPQPAPPQPQPKQP
jgi:RHS repeat-associated protein